MRFKIISPHCSGIIRLVILYKMCLTEGQVFTPLSPCTTFFVLPLTNTTNELKFDLITYGLMDTTPRLIIDSSMYTGWQPMFRIPLQFLLFKKRPKSMNCWAYFFLLPEHDVTFPNVNLVPSEYLKFDHYLNRKRYIMHEFWPNQFYIFWTTVPLEFQNYLRRLTTPNFY